MKIPRWIWNGGLQMETTNIFEIMFDFNLKTIFFVLLNFEIWNVSFSSTFSLFVQISKLDAKRKNEKNINHNTICQIQCIKLSNLKYFVTLISATWFGSFDNHACMDGLDCPRKNIFIKTNQRNNEIKSESFKSWTKCSTIWNKIGRLPKKTNLKFN